MVSVVLSRERGLNGVVALGAGLAGGLRELTQVRCALALQEAWSLIFNIFN